MARKKRRATRQFQTRPDDPPRLIRDIAVRFAELWWAPYHGQNAPPPNPKHWRRSKQLAKVVRIELPRAIMRSMETFEKRINIGTDADSVPARSKKHAVA